MAEEKKFTEAEAHRHFAIQFHGRTWDLMEKTGRTRDEDEQMVNFAFSSLTHWLYAGTAVNHQRGQWLLSRVYVVLGKPELSLFHAERCLELTEANQEDMEDFDFAFAYECVARANALADNHKEAKKYSDMAQQAGEVIKDEEDRKVFFADFNGGDWAGFR